MHRALFRALLAEPDERRRGVFQLWLAAIAPELRPLLIERIHIVARCRRARIMEGFGVDIGLFIVGMAGLDEETPSGLTQNVRTFMLFRYKGLVIFEQFV